MLVKVLRISGLFNIGGELQQPQLGVADAPALPGRGAGGGGQGAHPRGCHGEAGGRGLVSRLQEWTLSKWFDIMVR